MTHNTTGAPSPQEEPGDHLRRLVREVFDEVRREAGLPVRGNDLAAQRGERRRELERQGFPFATDADMASLTAHPEVIDASPPVTPLHPTNDVGVAVENRRTGVRWVWTGEVWQRVATSSTAHPEVKP